MRNQTRREFIFDSTKIFSVIIGTAALGKGLILPQIVEASDLQFAASSCGIKKMAATKF